MQIVRTPTSIASTLLLTLPLACAAPKSSAPAAEEAVAQPTVTADDREDGAPPSAPSGRGMPEPEPAAAAGDGLADNVDADRPARPAMIEESKTKGELGPELTLAVPALNGGLDRDIIRRKVSDQLDDLRSCYGRALAANPDLAGELVVRVELDGEGRVTKTALAKQNAMLDKQVQACALELIEGWELGAPSDGEAASAELSFGRE